VTTLPVNAIYSSVQLAGHWAGTPALMIRLMTTPDVTPDESEHDTDWDYDPRNEVSVSRVMAKGSDASPHFAYVGANTLAATALNHRERHIVFVGREPHCHDLGGVVHLLREAGRQVQVETAGRVKALAADGAWVTLRALPQADWLNIDPATVRRADEILAYVRGRADLERANALFGPLTTPVWLSPARSSEPAVYYQCVSMAARHMGWRALRC
jgi:organic radical activating enzyme